MADLLSLNKVVGPSVGLNNSPMRQRSHIASLAAWVAAMYSASVVDNVTNSCFFEDHETPPPSTRNMYPEIARLCSCDAPSASTYPSRPLLSPPYTNSSFFVPNR